MANTYCIRNMLGQKVPSNVTVDGKITERNIAPRETFEILDTEIGPSMLQQIDNKILAVIQIKPGGTPSAVSIPVTPEQRSALDNANLKKEDVVAKKSDLDALIERIKKLENKSN